MIRLRHKIFLQAFKIFDQVVLVAVLLFLIAVFEEQGSFAFLGELLEKSYQVKHSAAIAALLLGWYAIFIRIIRYDANRFTPLISQLLDILKATTASTLVLLAAAVAFDISFLTNKVIFMFWIFSSVLIAGNRFALRCMLMLIRRSGLNRRHVVFVGTNPRALEFAARIDSRPELGYQIVGFIAEDDLDKEHRATISQRWAVVDKVSEIRHFLERGIVDEVMICLSIQSDFSTIYDIIQRCRELGIVVRLVPDLFDVKILAQLQIEQFDGDFVVTFFRENLLFQLFVKRIMDLTISITTLVVLSPILLLTAICIKATSPGPVFFAQERIAMNKRTFRLLKFRSMVQDAEARREELEPFNEMDGPVFKMKKDPRVTKVGAFIRKFSIDELPQLLNVIKGEMSLVGPRPPLPSEVDIYHWADRRRLCIKPGITCLWQVRGRNEVDFEEWMELDRHYIEHWSIWMDLTILLRTVPVVLLGRGAS